MRKRRVSSWPDDFGKVQWGTTARLNVFRAFVAGVVWAVIVLIASLGGPARVGTMPWGAIPFVAALGYIGLAILFVTAARIIAGIAGKTGMLGVSAVTFLFGLAIAVGDPLVFMLRRTRPSLVPVARFRPFNAALVLFVLEPVEMAWKWRYY